MARIRDDLAESLNTEASRSLFGFVAEEEDLDRRALWRLGSWAVGSIAALVLAIMVSQSSIQGHQDQQVAADLARQSQQIQRLTKEAQAEVTRLGSAIETLNSDRDRLFSRVTVVEQNLESVTGSIARQVAAFKPQTPSVPTAGSEPPAAAPAQPAAKPGPPPATIPAEIVEGLQKSSREASARAAATLPPAPTAAPSVAGPPAKPADAAATPSAATPSADASPTKPMAEAPAKPLVDQSPAPAKPPAQVLISKSMLAPPDPAAGKLLEPPPPPATAPPQAPEAPTALAPAPPAPMPAPAALPVVASTAEPDPPPSVPLPAIPAQRSEFGIDLGSANSLDGLRAIWQRLTKANKTLGALHPIVVVKERGSNMQLRLVAGPISDAATAAKLCAGMAAADYFCETTVYDGQRLSMPAPRSNRKRTSATLAPPEPEPPQPLPQAATPPQPPHSALLSFLGVH